MLLLGVHADEGVAAQRGGTPRGPEVSWLESAGIPLYRGHGRISAERVVEVTGATAPPPR
jgi:hypothetical protein